MSEEVMKNSVQEFLINKDKDETNMTLDFAKALLTLDLEIKQINNDKKEIKNDAKSNGVSINKVSKALKAMKDALKEKPNDVLELETIETVLNNDVDIRTMISELARKD